MTSQWRRGQLLFFSDNINFFFPSTLRQNGYFGTYPDFPQRQLLFEGSKAKPGLSCRWMIEGDGDLLLAAVMTSLQWQ
ncbi:hypothetical protein Q3G72_021277 [Acer saccharum]|nr:hypothetical protein Q3G72_021277 [Acer saccharum]